MSENTVRIGDLLFSGGEGSTGFFIRDNGLEGLLDGVDVRRERVARLGDGNFKARSTLDARVVTIGGLFFGESAEVIGHNGRRLKALQSIRDEFPVLFEFEGNTVWGMGHVSDKPSFKPVMWGSISNWDLELQFDDPTLFGESRSSAPVAPGVAFTLANYGNEKSPPVYTIDGNFPAGYTINGPSGAKYQVTRAVVPGAPHRVDMSDGYLTIGGVKVFGQTPFADTWPVPNGGVLSTSMTATGTGTITGSVADRYN